jgi:hypothetical protein
VVAAQSDPATQRVIQLTVSEADGATAKPKPSQQVIEHDEEPVLKPMKPANKWDDEDEEEDDEPKVVTKRASKQAEPSKPVGELADVLDAWADEDD